MTKKTPSAARLEDMPLWKEVCDLAEYIYSTLHQFPVEEKWNTQNKLRASANDLMFVTSQALGNSSPSGGEYEWGQARKHLAGLKTMYRFAGRQHFIELDPEIMVRLQAVDKQLDGQIRSAYAKTQSFNEEEMDRWQAKYKMWGHMNGKSKDRSV